MEKKIYNEMNGEQELNSTYIAKSKPVYHACKRVFDFVMALLALIVLSLVFLILAIVIKCQDGGPVFYRQMRIGKNGKKIGIYKFRSMKVGADKLEDVLTPEQLELYQKEFKLDDDPRVTRVGNFLRKTSLDELPQLINILGGSLSIVGPRPIIEEEIKVYSEEDQPKFLSVKPGLTGYWQAYARNNATYASGERQKMELYYVDNASFWLDLKIIFRTVIAVIRRDGAK